MLVLCIVTRGGRKKCKKKMVGLSPQDELRCDCNYACMHDFILSFNLSLHRPYGLKMCA